MTARLLRAAAIVLAWVWLDRRRRQILTQAKADCLEAIGQAREALTVGLAIATPFAVGLLIPSGFWWGVR